MLYNVFQWYFHNTEVFNSKSQITYRQIILLHNKWAWRELHFSIPRNSSSKNKPMRKDCLQIWLNYFLYQSWKCVSCLGLYAPFIACRPALLHVFHCYSNPWWGQYIVYQISVFRMSCTFWQGGTGNYLFWGGLVAQEDRREGQACEWVASLLIFV